MYCSTPWGRWWQTVGEVFVEVEVPKGTRGRDVQVEITPTHVSCTVRGKSLFSGNLRRTVVADESTWTIEEQQRLLMLLVKTEPANSEKVWESLLEGQYAPDPLVMHEMMKKLDLEKFQIENPGFDFSNAQLDKAYERIPGLGNGTPESQLMELHVEGDGEGAAETISPKPNGLSL